MTEAIVEASPQELARGSGRLAFARVGNRTVVTHAAAGSPLRLLTPRVHDQQRSHGWGFTSTFGGGLVAGDRIALEVEAGAGTTCYLSTQSSTKVYRCANGERTEQRLTARVEEEALLVSAPDPLVCFEGAHYRQAQRFDMAASGGLVMLDWFTSGRHAAGERWRFRRLESRNHIVLGGKRILEDVVRLDGTAGPLTGDFGMGGFNCFGTLVLVGNRVAGYAGVIRQALERAPISTASPMFGVSPLGNGVIVRVTSVETEKAARFLRDLLGFLAEVFGEHPWQRKW